MDAADKLDDGSTRLAIVAWLKKCGHYGGTTLEFGLDSGMDRSNFSSTFTRLETDGHIKRKLLGRTEKGHPIYQSRVSPGSQRESCVWWVNG